MQLSLKRLFQNRTSAQRKLDLKSQVLFKNKLYDTKIDYKLIISSYQFKNVLCFLQLSIESLIRR